MRKEKRDCGTNGKSGKILFPPHEPVLLNCVRGEHDKQYIYYNFPPVLSQSFGFCRRYSYRYRYRYRYLTEKNTDAVELIKVNMSFRVLG